MDRGEKTSSEEAAVLISDCYRFCWNGIIIGCFLSHTEDKVAWTFKGSNLDWPCPVNGWPATATNEAVCRRWVWNDWSIYYSSTKLQMCVCFICFFVCLHEVRGNCWRQDNSNFNHFLPPICCTYCMSRIEILRRHMPSQSIQWWCILHKKTECFFMIWQPVIWLPGTVLFYMPLNGTNNVYIIAASSIYL